MSKNLILNIALPVPMATLFDYLPPEGIDISRFLPGIRVLVPFTQRTLTGVLCSVSTRTNVPNAKLKRVISLLDQRSLFSPDIYKLCYWAADYYHYPLGEVFATAMPTLLRKGALTESVELEFTATENRNPEPELSLNEAQQKALHAICEAENTFHTFLLDGVTGSGKTEIYLRAIANVLQAGKQALVLIPEISLTPQTIARFRARFNVPIVALHSSLSEKKRLQAYLAAHAGIVKIIIGTRSAVFTPFANLGLIIIDEEHDTSFKQQDGFRYHARDLAIVRARMNNIPIVLGSATPSLESLYNVHVKKRYTYLALRERAGTAQLPTYEILDLRSERKTQGITLSLLEKIKQHLAADNQVLLFLNKRGFAPVLYCTACAYIMACKNCSTHLVYHQKPKRLHCHHCDFKMLVPSTCTQCGKSNLEPVGLGTQRLEETLAEHFPDTPIIRVDRDNTRRKGAMQNLFAQIHAAKRAILLGTQMLAKGHHFPNITLVGIIDADSGFFSVDFRATEQLGQLFLQVAGRAGREHKAGTVALQTLHPENQALQILLRNGYQQFAKYLLQERKQALLPPYTYFARFRAEAKDETKTQNFLNWLKQMACKTLPQKNVEILGPVPAIMVKRKGLYCYHLLIKAESRNALQQFLTALMPQLELLPKALARIKWILDVDPIEV